MGEIPKPFSNVTVESFEGLLVDYGKRVGARVIVRRAPRCAPTSNTRLQIAHANADLKPEIDTVFLPTRTNYALFRPRWSARSRATAVHVSRYAPEAVW